MSRRHAEFRREGSGFTVHDVGCLNGTYVNRERIDGEAAAAGGDEVQIGKFRLVFQHPTAVDQARRGAAHVTRPARAGARRRRQPGHPQHR